jgi:hypothetical protein
VICHTGGNSIPRDAKRVILFYESRWKLLKKHGKITFPRLVALLISLRLAVETLVLLLYKNKGLAQKNKWEARKYLLGVFLQITRNPNYSPANPIG